MTKEYEIQVCVLHEEFECEKCQETLNDMVRGYRGIKNKEDIDKHREHINNWGNDNFKTIKVVKKV